MSIRELPKDCDKSFPETKEQTERRKVVEAKLSEMTSKVQELQAKKEKERTDRAIVEVLLRIRERAGTIETHFRDSLGTKQPHTAKGAIKDFEKIVDDEIAKARS